MLKVFILSTFFILSVTANDLTLKINDKQHFYDNFKLNYLKDNNSSLTIDNIKRYKFTKEINNMFNLGYIKGNLWFKLNLLNTTKDKKTYILSLNETFYEKVNIYYLDKYNKLVKKTNGIFKLIDQRGVKINYLAFEIDIEPNIIQTCYIEIYGKYAYFGNITLKNKEYFFEDNLFNINSMYILLLGIIIAIMIFNIFSYIKLKDKIYLYYIGYVFFNLIYILNISGLLVYLNLQQFIYSLHFSASFMMALLILFSIEYLNIKKYMKKVNIFLKFISILFFIFGFLIIYSYTPWNKVINNLAGIVSIILFIVSIIIYSKGKQKTKYYTIALLFYLIFVFEFTFMVIGIIDYTYTTRYGFVIALTIEMLIFSLLLSNRYSSIKDENEIFLKNLVDIRTKKLEEGYLRIESLLIQRDNLLKEMHHRVKNNFHMIMAFLWFSKEANDSNLIIKNTRSRIKSMSIIHEKLYKKDNITHIAMKDYLAEIIEHTLHSNEFKSYKLKCYLENILLNYEEANSLGMILNEVLLNSIKHNISNKNLILDIKFYEENDNVIFLIKDNGLGFDINKPNDGMGMILVKSFSKKLLDSSYNFKIENGLIFTLKFKKRI